MTKNIVFDSYALIAHFKKEKGHEVVSEMLTEISVGERTGYLTLINLGEIYYITHRANGEKNALEAMRMIKSMPIEIVGVDEEITMRAAKIKATHKLSFADAFAAALTIAKKATLITGDKEFKGLEGGAYFKVKFI